MPLCSHEASLRASSSNSCARAIPQLSKPRVFAYCLILVVCSFINFFHFCGESSKCLYKLIAFLKLPLKNLHHHEITLFSSAYYFNKPVFSCSGKITNKVR